MPTLLNVAFQELDQRVQSINAEMEALPWYAFVRRLTLLSVRDHINAIQSHLRTEQRSVDGVNDAYSKALSEEYNPASSWHQSILQNIITRR